MIKKSEVLFLQLHVASPPMEEMKERKVCMGVGRGISNWKIRQALADRVQVFSKTFV